jgi:hypothetical protein
MAGRSRLEPATNQYVDGPSAGTFDQQVDRPPQQHAEIRSCFVRHAPKPVTRELGDVKNPEIMAEKDGDFRRKDRDDHNDDKRDHGETGAQSDDDKSAAKGLAHADKRADYVGARDADMGKTGLLPRPRETSAFECFRERTR